MDQKIDTRDRILHAATERIKHYGYNKTTMAEIAADCRMSPGNIYRFFEAKIDIADAMVRQHSMEQNGRLAGIARRKAAPADQRLRDIVTAQMRENYALIERNPKLVELAEVLRTERPLHHAEQMALQRVFLAEVLKDGAEAGLFRPMEVEYTAEMVQAATQKFLFPLLLSVLTLPKLERELEGVLTLILNGLYRPDYAPRAAANEQ